MDILLVHQRHFAKKAGEHIDWRVVVGDKAYSWATKKEMPKPGEKIVLHEQPVHDAAYATSPKIEIPDGQYGAGTTVLEYAQKGTAEIRPDDVFKLRLNNGHSFTIKKLPKLGEKVWMCMNTSNKYLEKAARYWDYETKDRVDTFIHDRKLGPKEFDWVDLDHVKSLDHPNTAYYDDDTQEYAHKSLSKLYGMDKLKPAQHKEIREYISDHECGADPELLSKAHSYLPEIDALTAKKKTYGKLSFGSNVGGLVGAGALGYLANRQKHFSTPLGLAALGVLAGGVAAGHHFGNKESDTYHKIKPLQEKATKLENQAFDANDAKIGEHLSKHYGVGVRY